MSPRAPTGVSSEQNQPAPAASDQQIAFAALYRQYAASVYRYAYSPGR